MIDIDTWEQIEGHVLTGGLTLLMGYMAFIVWRLGVDSKAGKMGFFALFLALGLGMLGFIIKGVLVEMLGG
ncbi:MAG: DUF2788 domain-containing protein [Chromatiales bacterium]|jgi:hypothetical protein|nr:DUF2788 domain-containing protein [Chromatiales bacterium]MDX9767378.1 DUF2788 domain-containing protein [Ectothiorhodospiraceae bacterium]